MTIKIIQINIQSLKSNADLLIEIMERRKIDVAILSETWTKKNQTIRFKNYNIETNNREDGYGGVGIMIKKNIQGISKKLTQYNPIEAIETKLQLKEGEIKIISIYIPPNQSLTEIREKATQLLMRNDDNNTIIAGDINAKSTSWGNKSNCPRGKLIAEIINNTNLYIANNGEMTNYNDRFNTATAIDLTLASTNLNSQLEWEVMDEIMGSGHRPIGIKLYGKNSYNRINKERINITQTVKDINSFNPKHTFSMEDYEETIEEIIKENTSTIHQSYNNSPKPWWNPKIGRLWKIKKQKQQIYNRSKDLDTAIELKRAIAKIKREIKKAKKQTWLKFITNITSNMTGKQIWENINKIKKGKYTNQNFVLNKQTALNILKKHFREQTKSKIKTKHDSSKAYIDEFHWTQIKNIIDKN